MKKKLIIIVSVIIVFLGVLLFVVFSGDKEETLHCYKEEVQEGKTASINNEYILHSNGVLYSKTTINMTFLTKAEADKHEAAVRLAFIRDEITRKNNNITILSESEEESELSINDIKSKMESKGFSCS